MFSSTDVHTHSMHWMVAPESFYPYRGLQAGSWEERKLFAAAVSPRDIAKTTSCGNMSHFRAPMFTDALPHEVCCCMVRVGSFLPTGVGSRSLGSKGNSFTIVTTNGKGGVENHIVIDQHPYVLVWRHPRADSIVRSREKTHQLVFFIFLVAFYREFLCHPRAPKTRVNIAIATKCHTYAHRRSVDQCSSILFSLSLSRSSGCESVPRTVRRGRRLLPTARSPIRVCHIPPSSASSQCVQLTSRRQ